MTLFDQPPTLESLLARIEALEAKVMDKPVRQSTEVPEELRQAWSLWYLHKAGSKNWTAAAKKAQVAKLFELAGFDGDLAVKIVNQSIERGWTTFFPFKDAPKLSIVPKVGAKAALEPSETPLEKRLNQIRHAHHFGQIDAAERDRRIVEATNKYRNSTNQGVSK